MPYRTRADAFWAGVRALIPLTPGVVPFGLLAGVMAIGVGMTPGMAMGMTLLFYSGSAQMVALQLMQDDVLPVAIIFTALIINLRFLMYSASLAPYLHHLPRRWTWPLSYMLSDQSYATCILKLSSGELGRFAHFFYVGTALTMWLSWQLSVMAGIFLGTSIPDTWSLSFAIPLSFLALLVPAIRNSASLGAAVVAGVVAVWAVNMPYNLGLLTASIAGIGAGLLISKTRQQTADDTSVSNADREAP
ncbi:putative branched-subunit amino acid permease [Pseudomonas sp. BIGb0408]|uniref:Putative branched-subunit amino acid permease n=1 Tax=Phytopseudomonas flavescens TaxID=29435 RepID=A0A7Z0BP06_9GAMM|nr:MULTISPECIES: AzlC family ABC transporter permease [Pseudomonas]MCW2291262.1 putative branched-subunit amino acid permease [Pseudomonas sp. BIGb0408]NYH74167.1 putative branched-subunit amino acid permease [Pseudomonas flavescens]